MQIDDGVVKLALPLVVAALATSITLMFRSGQLSRDAKKAVKDVERHEKVLEGDREVDPPQTGLRVLARMTYEGMLSNTKVLKAILRGLRVTSASDEHRIEEEVRRSVAAGVGQAGREARDSDVGFDPETTQQRQQRERVNVERARLVAEEDARERDRERERHRFDEERQRLPFRQERFGTDRFGTPLLPRSTSPRVDPRAERPVDEDLVVSDPFADLDRDERPHPRAVPRPRRDTPYDTKHSTVNLPAVRPKKKSDEGGGSGGGGEDDSSGE